MIDGEGSPCPTDLQRLSAGEGTVGPSHIVVANKRQFTRSVQESFRADVISSSAIERRKEGGAVQRPAGRGAEPGRIGALLTEAAVVWR